MVSFFFSFLYFVIYIIKPNGALQKEFGEVCEGFYGGKAWQKIWNLIHNYMMYKHDCCC